MKELNGIIAANISELRKTAGMTQNDLAEKLNYSDKAVSKWERGESIPDISVLKSIADLFGVTVDYLLTLDHQVYKEERRAVRKRKKSNRLFISLISVVAVWLVAVFIYLQFDIFLKGVNGTWLVFVYAVPVSAIVAVIFNCLWGKRLLNLILSSAICWSLITSVFLTLVVCEVDKSVWLLFVLGVPVQIIILLWSRLRFK